MVTVTPADIWKYYKDKKPILATSEFLVAESNDGRDTVYITDENDVLNFNYYENDDLIMVDEATNEGEAIDAYCGILAVAGINFDDNFDDDDPAADDTIADNEERLHDAVGDLLFTITDGECFTFDKDYESCVAAILEVACRIAHDKGFVVYRPMKLMRDGKEFFTEYPYPELYPNSQTKT